MTENLCMVLMFLFCIQEWNQYVLQKKEQILLLENWQQVKLKWYLDYKKCKLMNESWILIIQSAQLKTR